MRDTIDMAREAGFMLRAESVKGQSDWWECFDEAIEKLVALARADERVRAMRENAYVQAEREACANDKLDAERYRHMRNNAQFQSRNGPGLYWYLPRFGDGKVRDEGKQLDDAIDAAIRARGNT